MRKGDNTLMIIHSNPGIPPQQFFNVTKFHNEKGESGVWEHVWEYDQPTKFDEKTRKPDPKSIVRAEGRIAIGKVVVKRSWYEAPDPAFEILTT